MEKKILDEDSSSKDSGSKNLSVINKTSNK